MRTRFRAFTLIELLVVIAIIALLISILLPALTRARQQAKSAVCLSNMRGIGLAIYAYANDQRDFLPGVGLAHGGSGEEIQGSWFSTLLRPYADPMLAICPTDESDHFTLPVDPAVPTSIRRVSYASNYYTVAPIGNRKPFNRLSSFPRASTTVLYCELTGQGPYAAADHVHPEQWFSNPRQLASEQVAIERHGKTANYLLADGHAQPFRFEQTYDIDLERSNFPELVWKHNLYDPLVAH